MPEQYFLFTLIIKRRRHCQKESIKTVQQTGLLISPFCRNGENRVSSAESGVSILPGPRSTCIMKSYFTVTFFVHLYSIGFLKCVNSITWELKRMKFFSFYFYNLKNAWSIFFCKLVFYRPCLIYTDFINVFWFFFCYRHASELIIVIQKPLFNIDKKKLS